MSTSTTTAPLPTNLRGTLIAGPPSTAAARKRWLAARRAGLGASEVSTILGLAPPSWQTSPLQVWLEKVDPAGAGVVPTERMLWGLRLERPIADEYRVRHAEARGVYVAPSPGLLAHPEHPWLLATPDRLLLDRATRRTALGLLEIKTADAMLAREWDAGVPLHYQVQVQVQMGITGLEWCDVVPLLGGNYMPEPHRVEFDPLAFGQIVELCGAWWEGHVVTGVPPEPLPEDLQFLPQVWPEHADEEVVLPEGLAQRLEVQARIKARIKALEAASKRVELDTKVFMKNAKVARLPDGQKAATWSRFPTSKFALDRFRDDNPVLAAQYTETTDGQRFTVHKFRTEEEQND